MVKHFATFAKNQKKSDGTEMYGYWIEITAENSQIARQLMMEWAAANMPTRSTWGMLYDEQNFQSQYYEKGMFLQIRQTSAMFTKYTISGTAMGVNIICGDTLFRVMEKMLMRIDNDTHMFNTLAQDMVVEEQTTPETALNLLRGMQRHLSEVIQITEEQIKFNELSS